MTQTAAQQGAATPSKTITRPGASRAILRAKAAGQKTEPAGEALEDMFPSCADAGASAPADAPVPATPQPDATAEQAPAKIKPTKADQLIVPGAVTPNPDTVPAVIVGIVQERGSMRRADIIAAMAGAEFRHPKAKPADKIWANGYVSGCLRNNFLALAEQGAEVSTPADKSADAEL